MLKTRIRHLVAILAAALVLGSCASPVIRLRTDLGVIDIELQPLLAPTTCANFLRYVDAGLYDNAEFYRTVRPDNQQDTGEQIQVIQAQLDPARRREQLRPIPLESTEFSGLKHLDGTVSMARSGKANSVQSEFFICIGAQPSLDFGSKQTPDGQGFAPFGKVISGNDVVRMIQNAKAKGENLTPPIRIQTARRLNE